MTITKIGNKIIIDGNIATISDVVKIKDALKDIPKGSEITIFLKNSMMLPSSLLGMLLKFVQVDKIKVNIEYVKEEIGSLLEEMDLTKIFHTRKVT